MYVVHPPMHGRMYTAISQMSIKACTTHAVIAGGSWGMVHFKSPQAAPGQIEVHVIWSRAIPDT